jgi:type II secretory pathway component PulM
MKRYWSTFAGRIDDMALRQRAMLFATISLVVIALAHVLLIEPVLVKQKRLIDGVNRNQSQLSAVRGQIESFLKEQESGRKDPAQMALAAMEAGVAQAEKTLA